MSSKLSELVPQKSPQAIEITEQHSHACWNDWCIQLFQVCGSSGNCIVRHTKPFSTGCLWTDFPNYKIRSNSDLLPLFIDKPMMYHRGSKFQYNNTGFVVLAMIIEKITGKPFDEYLQQSIFEPCEMTDTGYYELDRLPAKCATNYIYDKRRNEYRTNIFSVDAKGTGAGGAFTTVNDIKQFWNSLFSGKLLRLEMTSNMIINHSGEAECYGYGIWLRKNGEYLIPFFQGCDPGVSFISCYDIPKKLLIVLVSNYGDNVWRLLDDVIGNLDKLS